MNSFDKPTVINSSRDRADVKLVGSGEGAKRVASSNPYVAPVAVLKSKIGSLSSNSELWNVVGTFLTTLTVFGIFFIQGIILARILGPLGRGEFGTAIQIPRDLLLYAGLLGGIEIVNTYASKGVRNLVSLKYSAARMGLITGSITAIVAGVASVVFLSAVGKQQLIPFCLLCCLFLPWEHMHLIVSGVDRGNHEYSRYNFNRLFFAITFPAMVLLAFPTGLVEFLGLGQLSAVCIIFVLSKVIGLLPTLRGMDIVGLLKRKPSALANLQNSETGDVPSTRTLLKEGKPYAISVFASELFERLDVLLIVALGTLTECGYYMVAVPAAALLTVAPNALAVFTFNAGANEKRRVKKRDAAAVVSFVVVLQIISTIVLSLLLPWLIVTFYTEAFAPAIAFALWLLPAAAIKGYLQAADGYLKGRGKPMIGVWSRVVSTCAMLLFVFFTYSQFENRLLSIPIAACVGQAISMVVISYFVFADVNSNRPMKEMPNAIS